MGHWTESAPTKGEGSDKSTLNSTQTPLGSAGTYTGTWEENFSPHAIVNLAADQDGTLYIDFGVDDGAGGVTTTFTQETLIYADSPDFIAVVKGPRWFRVRYVNGSTAQSSFSLLSAFGQNFLPVAASNDNETLVTVTERERDVYAAMNATDVTSDTYAILVDLSDTTNFPHSRTGRVDLTGTYISIDRNSTATGFVRIGVITRIDGTDADISWVAGVTFEKSDARQIIRDRKYSPSQLKCGVVSGALNRIVSAFESASVTAVNTGVSMDSPRGSATVTPAVGDIIVGYGRTAGSFNASVSAHYHGELAP